MGILSVWASAHALVVLVATGILLAGGLVRAVRCQRASAARRAQLHLALMREVARLTLDPAQEGAVARLLRTATALRRERRPSVARSLFALSSRRSPLQREAELLLGPGRRYPPGDVSVTMR